LSNAITESLIPGGSPLYGTLANMSKGQWVRFDAALLDLMDLTERGKVMEPDMEARFVTIEALH
jgi:hypothetical protein